MRKISLLLALVASFFVSQAHADFTGKNAATTTITFKNPNDCTAVVCTPIFAQYDSTGANAVAVLTVGADAASNTATGALGYSRMLSFNGTTWDRWQGAIKAASGAFASGSIASGAFASGAIGSGAIASGAVASGAVASGAYAAGSIASGAMVDLGAQADSAAAADNSTASLIALVKRTNQNLTTLNTTAGGAVPAGTNTIGNVGADPSSGKATPTMAFLAFPATTTTQIIALSGSKVTYVTMAKVFAGGSVNLTFKYGTGSNCGTGTTTLEGPYGLTAQAGWTEGNGSGPVMIVPSGQALCITTDATVSNSGVKLIYQQF